VQIPVVEKRLGISNATLGSLLVLLGLGAFIGSRSLAGLADRSGTRVVVPPAGVLCGAPLCYPALPAILGGWQGCWSRLRQRLPRRMSMNAHAVHVEKA